MSLQSSCDVTALQSAAHNIWHCENQTVAGKKEAATAGDEWLRANTMSNRKNVDEYQHAPFHVLPCSMTHFSVNLNESCADVTAIERETCSANDSTSAATLAKTDSGTLTCAPVISGNVEIAFTPRPLVLNSRMHTRHSVLLPAQFSSEIFALFSAIIRTFTVSYLGHPVDGKSAAYRSWAREGIGTSCPRFE
jgi:hypothetical protein